MLPAAGSPSPGSREASATSRSANPSDICWAIEGGSRAHSPPAFQEGFETLVQQETKQLFWRNWDLCHITCVQFLSLPWRPVWNEGWQKNYSSSGHLWRGCKPTHTIPLQSPANPTGRQEKAHITHKHQMSMWSNPNPKKNLLDRLITQRNLFMKVWICSPWTAGSTAYLCPHYPPLHPTKPQTWSSDPAPRKPAVYSCTETAMTTCTAT